MSAFPVRIGGQVRDFDLGAYISAKDARRMDDFMHYGVAAGIQAMVDSGFDVAKSDAGRCGAIMGAGIGGLGTIESEYGEYLKAHNPRRISPSITSFRAAGEGPTTGPTWWRPANGTT